MKFERLRLAGFKTFVEPAELLIAPGLTGVVGPNGCGKSNLVEALRWVMGETSSKSLRGGGMDDVIFGGSTTRPERNHAEVSIRIGAPPADLPGHLAGAEHIEIARKIVREQGSTYRMNGREVRARDVQILFADAASGARSPSMVRQGQIGEIISAKPQHRRRILEDAAGVAGLHARRHEAELRLRQADENLTRAEDLLGQLDRQIADLRKQARQSERYKAIAAEIRDLELLLLAAGLAKAQQEEREARAQHDLAVRAISVAMAAQGEAERTRAIAAHEIEGLRQQAAEAGATHQKKLIARETLDNEKRLAEQRLQEIEARKRDAIRDAAAATAVLTDAEQSVTRLAGEGEDIVSALAAEAAGQAADTAAVSVAETARLAAERLLATLQAEAAEASAARRAGEQRLHEAQARRDRLAHARDEAGRELSALTGSDPALARIDALRAAEEARVAEYEAALAANEAAEQAGHAARAAEQAARPRFGEAERVLQRLETEARTIRKLVENTEPGLWTPAIDLITVSAGLETALAAALGEDLEASVDAGASRHWSANGTPSADLPKLPPGAEAITAFVSAPASLHPRLSQIGLVTREAGATLQKQLRQGQRLVSREGDLWRWDGFTAKAEAQSSAARRLAERNRLAEIEAQILDARTRRDEARGVLDTAQRDLREKQEAEAHTRDAARRCAAAREVASSETQREMRRSEEARLRLEALRNRLASLTIDHEEAAALCLEITGELGKLANGPDYAPRLADFDSRTREARALEAAAILEQRQRNGRLTSLRDRQAANARENDAWAARATRARAASIEHAARLDQLEAEARRLEGVPATLAAHRRAIESDIESAEAAARVAGDELARGETRLRTADEQAREAFRRLSETREAGARLDALRETSLARLDQLSRSIEEQMDGTLATLAERVAAIDAVADRDPATLEARLTDLRQDRDRLGAVNLRADVELATIEEERADLAREREDVIEAIRKFRRAIDALNGEGRNRLRTAFAEVNAHFGTLFQRLFGGGTAELQLVEAEDPLEAGLEILARPPGKKPQLLSLLSGGEQALTATALIFAVFLTNPAPICVLDEVDAPLDDSNVERLCDLLADMARETETRFLMITHNPISMARMDRLYGVTMMERGVSQLVSVDLASAEKLAEAV